MITLKIVYAANIIVAGWIGINSLFRPDYSSVVIFQNAYTTTDVIRLTGCLWFAIACLSLAGLWFPFTFSPVLLLQLIYKGLWLIVVALPALKQNREFPSAMAVFFLIWVLVLPFVIPWSKWASGS